MILFLNTNIADVGPWGLLLLLLVLVACGIFLSVLSVVSSIFRPLSLIG